LAGFVIVENYVGAAVYVALWIIGEILTLRRKRRNATSDERLTPS
jgi:hypothetical protein